MPGMVRAASAERPGAVQAQRVLLFFCRSCPVPTWMLRSFASVVLSLRCAAQWTFSTWGEGVWVAADRDAPTNSNYGLANTDTMHTTHTDGLQRCRLPPLKPHAHQRLPEASLAAHSTHQSLCTKSTALTHSRVTHRWFAEASFASNATATAVCAPKLLRGSGLHYVEFEMASDPKTKEGRAWALTFF
eukprot:1935258-Rhodomonas_salina.1